MSNKKVTHATLDSLCKANKIKGYSGKKLDEKKALLTAKGINYELAESKEATVSKPKNPTTKRLTTSDRSNKLDKKLLEFIKIDNYTSELTDFKEELSNSKILTLIKKDILLFVNSLSLNDYESYVDKYGLLKLLKEYEDCHKTNILSFSYEEIYKMLLSHILTTDNKSTEALCKNITKYYNSLVKVNAKSGTKPNTKSKTKPVKPKKLEIKEVGENDDDEEDDDEDDDEDEDNEDGDNEDEDEINENEENEINNAYRDSDDDM
jgi:hypothetical protein